ncbi:MAG: cobalamin biosynthesis protein [Pseudomonadota bacterium]
MFETFQDLHSLIFDPSRLPVAAIALFISAFIGVMIGPVGGDTNPLYWRIISGLVGGMGGKMDKPGRPRGDLILRGFIITVVALLISYAIGEFLKTLVNVFPVWKVTEILALSMLLSSGALWIVLMKLHKALEQKTVGEGTYYALARTARQNLSVVDDYTITRTGIGLAVRGFDKALVAPIVWYLILGLPGAYVYAALAALSWRFGRDGTSNGFAVIMIALEKLTGMIPSIFSATLLSLACVFTPTAMMTKALKGWNAHKNNAPYPEGGLPMTAVAWGLEISLGGPATDLDGHVIKRTWVGPQGATAQLDSKHLHRAVYCVLMATLLLFMTLIGGMIVSGHQLLDF